jgi:hypothetical protein
MNERSLANTFLSGVKFVLCLLLLEWLCFEYLYCWDESFGWWDKYHLRSTADADEFVKVWQGRFSSMMQTIFRDNFQDFFKRVFRFLAARFYSHGKEILVLYVIVVHFRLHSMFRLLLEEVGLGFINNLIDWFVDSIWSSEPSLEDIPALIDEDEDEEVDKAKKKKKDGESKSKNNIKIPSKRRRKPDTWLTYDRELGVIPLGVVRQWEKAKEQKRKNGDITGTENSDITATGSNGIRRSIPPVRCVGGTLENDEDEDGINLMELVD